MNSTTKKTKNTIGSRLMLCSATVLLVGVTAFAQVPGSGPAGGQQPSMPSQTSPSAQQAPGAGMPQADNSNTAMSTQDFSDKAFVKKALEGGEAEVQLGQLAQQKSQSADVKQFGQKMVQDHTQMGEQMKMVAKNLGVTEPKGPSKKDKQLMAKLSSLSGDQFDQEYIKAMVKDHKQDLKDFKDQAQMTQNPNLQKLTQMGANVVAQHLQMIEQIAQAHNVSEQASNK